MRFRPDSQRGGGFYKDFAKSATVEGWHGLKQGGLPLLPNLVGGARGVKKGAKGAVKRALKRKAHRTVDRAHKKARKTVNDIFGP